MKDLLPDPEKLCVVCGRLEWYIAPDGTTRSYARHLACKRKLGARYRARTYIPLSYIVQSDTGGGTIKKESLTESGTVIILDSDGQPTLF